MFERMVRKQRGEQRPLSAHEKTMASEGCAVCGLRDARALVSVVLVGGTRATMCGTHELMHRRAGGKAKSTAELRSSLAERRGTDRRGHGEVDELAARLAAAFTNERRASERRTG